MAVAVKYAGGADDCYSRSEMEHFIDEWIFNQRARAILKRRLLDGICFEPLAEEFDLSVRQVKNIVYKQQNTLYHRIEVAKKR